MEKMKKTNFVGVDFENSNGEKFLEIVVDTTTEKTYLLMDEALEIIGKSTINFAILLSMVKFLDENGDGMIPLNLLRKEIKNFGGNPNDLDGSVTWWNNVETIAINTAKKFIEEEQNV